MTYMTAQILDTFRQTFGDQGEVLVYFAPGRINLIGEHTDYNGGFVLPGSIDKGITTAISLNGSEEVRLYSLDFNEHSTFKVSSEELPKESWSRYIYGVVQEFRKKGIKVSGFNALFCGDIPLGAGLSSSAALESCYATALNDLFADGCFSKMDLALIGQQTEHRYVGVKCGIMDQFASLFGRAGHLMLLDCRSLEYEYLPFSSKEYCLLLVDSCVKHELASSAYNDRRHSCERVVAEVQKRHPEVTLLRDVTKRMLQEVQEAVREEDYICATYVVEEIERIGSVAKILKEAHDQNIPVDYNTIGSKMYETHRGMSSQYKVSCEELDFLNDLARKHHVTGSRVMGGGFGGCTINLIHKDYVDAFMTNVQSEFLARFAYSPKIYQVTIGDGARRLQ